MKIISHIEVRLKQIELLGIISNKFEEMELKYFLYYGTLIGAIRHNGFIPWDDDIDLAMPRHFYEKLDKIDWSQLGCDLIKPTSHKDSPYPFTKISRTDTLLVEDVDSAMPNLGVNIDIFPIDYLPESYLKRNIILLSVRLLLFFLALKVVKINVNRRLDKNIFLWVVKKLSFFVRANRLARSIDWLASSDLPSSTAGSILGPYGSREVFPSNVFEPVRKSDFEGKVMPLPASYDLILRGLYGDYMILPPMERRVTHHAYRVYDIGRKDA